MRIRARITGLAAAAVLCAALPVVAPVPPAAADAPLPGQVCSGSDWSGFSAANPWRRLDAGYVSVAGRTAVHLITRGHVAWSADPYRSSTWRAWFMSLKWLQDYYNKANGRMGVDSHVPTMTERRAFLEKALVILRDYDVSVPMGSSIQAAARRTSDGHRALVFACLAEEDKLLNGSTRSWLSSRLSAEISDVLAHQRGLAWNQTVEDMLPVLTAGCTTGRQDWLTAAESALAKAARTNIDAQGATIEQSLGYANYNLSLWERVLTRYADCGVSEPASLGDRLGLLASFLTAGTTPAGTLEQLGDTATQKARYDVIPGDQSFAWAQSGGTRGTAPPAVAVYDAGYVFGRPDRSFGGDYYTIRFGPARNYHGQRDATSVTWWPAGRPLVTDLGYPSSSQSARQKYWGTRYQNDVMVTGTRAGAERSAPSSLTTRSAGFGPSFTVTQSGGWSRVNHRRDVGVVPSLHAMVVRDYTYSGNGPVMTSQVFSLAPGYTARVGKNGRFNIYRGSALAYVAYAFGGSGRRSAVTTSVKYASATHGTKVTTLVQASIGRRATLGLVIVPSSVAFALHPGRIVLSTRSASASIGLGSYLS
ncbi:MAG: hypothetical protein GC157_06530 [Frankiales bacterium]|nr:hypothetical protein [Frankiales bacterium]